MIQSCVRKLLRSARKKCHLVSKDLLIYQFTMQFKVHFTLLARPNCAPRPAYMYKKNATFFSIGYDPLGGDAKAEGGGYVARNIW